MIKAEYIHHCGNDLTVANSARVSFFKESELEDDAWGPPKLKEKDAKLIRYLAREKHISPFGHCFATFRVKAPIFVARQLVKHKFLRWNEISRRYVSDNIEFYMPTIWRGKSEDKKQGSEGALELGQLAEEVEVETGSAAEMYYTLLEAGVAPEMARMVLPQSTMTEWYWSGSLDAFADMCRLRITPDTQYESRQVALGVDKIMLRIFPVSWEALEGYGND